MATLMTKPPLVSNLAVHRAEDTSYRQTWPAWPPVTTNWESGLMLEHQMSTVGVPRVRGRGGGEMRVKKREEKRGGRERAALGLAVMLVIFSFLTRS